MSLARDRSNLSYDALQKALGLGSARELEELVITAIYAGLLHATLDPARQAVQVTSIAPLRDLAPGTIPYMISDLQCWADRCQSTLMDLEEQMNGIRAAAIARETEKRASEALFQGVVDSLGDSDKGGGMFSAYQRDNLARKALSKRAMAESLGAESMDLDDASAADDLAKRAGKRKL